MSFNKKYLPDLPDLIKIREKYSSDQEFLDSYFRKVDSVMGPSDSFEYINKMKERLENEKRMGK
jgi:hypothetical protein